MPADTTALVFSVLGSACAYTAADGEPGSLPASRRATEQLITAQNGSAEIVGLMGKCLSIQGAAVDGAPVVLSDCVESPDQFWQRTALNQFREAGGKCLRTQNLSSSDGATIVLGPCGTGVSGEVWTKDGLLLR